MWHKINQPLGFVTYKSTYTVYTIGILLEILYGSCLGRH